MVMLHSSDLPIVHFFPFAVDKAKLETSWSSLRISIDAPEDTLMAGAAIAHEGRCLVLSWYSIWGDRQLPREGRFIAQNLVRFHLAWERSRVYPDVAAGGATPNVHAW